MTRRRRFARWFERAVLGAMMTVIAFVIERRLLRAIKEGTVKDVGAEHREGELAPTPTVRAP